MNRDRILVVPKQGARVLDPNNGQPLPPEGKEVEPSKHWLRRARDGDVTIKPVSAAKPAPKKANPKE